MSVLRNIERTIGGFFEGLFGRTFRSGVQPVELARKLAKEMDDHRTISIHRVYVPNEYTVYLAPPDREQFAGYEPQMRNELAEYLLEHARRAGYTLTTRPRVTLETEPDLAVGEFGIAVATSEAGDEGADAPPPAPPPPPPVERPAAPAPGATMVYAPEVAEVAPPPVVGVLEWSGEARELGGARTLIGRASECDITLDDPNVSRRHAELRQEGATYWLVDLDSTNGVEERGKRVKRLKLEDGTRFTLGSTEIAFSRELQ
jgi:hypothetical protein